MQNNDMTPAEAAVELGRTAQMVYYYINHGKLKKVQKRVNGELRTFISRKEVEKLKAEMYPAKG